MKSKYLFPAIALIVATTNIVHADNNGLVYPPADNSRIYEYPPQARANTYNQMPIAPPPYVFGRQAPAAPYAQPMVPPRNMMRPAPRQAPQYGRYPARRPVPYGMQNRRYPSYPSANNRRQTSPYGNSNRNGFNPFSGGNSPFSGNNFGMQNNPMNNMFGNNNNGSMPFFKQSKKKRKKAWGDERNIWPDFYTDSTDNAWDNMMGGPRDMGKMPGGWRFPYISTPDPVTVSDAITNQFPPIMEEGGNMMDFSDWGMFD